MSKISIDLTARLKQASQEMGNLQNGGLLKRWTESIEAKLQEADLPIDVFVSGDTKSDKSHPFQSLFSNSDVHHGDFFSKDGFRFHFIEERSIPIRKEGDIMCAMSIILLDQCISSQRTLQQWYRKNNYAYCLVITESSEGKESNPFYTPSRGTVKLKNTEWQGRELSDLIKGVFSESVFTAAKDRMALYSLNPVIQVLGDSISYENQLISVRKSISNQQNNALRKDEASLNFNDVSTTIRSLVQQVASDLEKEIKLKYDDLNRPTTGKFSNLSVEAASRINELESKQMAEKAERIGLNIKEKELNSILNISVSALEKEFKDDLTFINKRVESLISDINAKLRSKISDASIEFDNCAVTPERTLKSFAVYNKYYVGEMIKKGTMEYFVAIRDYVGIIMVAVGLFAPLGYVFGLFDLFAKEKSTTGQTMRTILMGVGGVLSVGLMVYGFFDLRKRIPLRRKEELERELNKARELIGAETKRIYSESSRDWSTSISTWIREFQNNLYLKVERILKEESGKLQQVIANQKVDTQKMTMGIDNLQKRIGTIQALRDQISTKHRELVQENDKTISSIQLNTNN